MTTATAATRGRTISTTDGRQKVDDLVMDRLVRQGLGNTAICRVLLAEHGISFTPAGVTYWKKTHGFPIRSWTPERLELIPWRVLPEHTRDRIYQALAAHARLEAGLNRDPDFELPRMQQQRRDKLMRLLRDTGTVVHYDQVNGWALVPPRPGIDNDVIRDPRFADDGTPIEDKTLWQ